ncbi:chromosome partitioning protein ParB, partial [Lactobacillus sp. XV13L]|nr:chromosome partitioning protein ParB [Lactobacillus sp. XV13L]
MARDSKSKETKKRGGLGRGIEALFEDEPQVEEAEEEILDLDLDDIRPNPYQPRKNFDDKALRELSASI